MLGLDLESRRAGESIRRLMSMICFLCLIVLCCGGWVKPRSRIHLNRELYLNSIPPTDPYLDTNPLSVFFGRTGLDLDRLFANRRLLGLLVGQDQVRVEQLERGELRVYYC